MTHPPEQVLNGRSLRLDATDSYAAILGAAPSKGARSPLLWNRAFKALGISAMMHPMDVAPQGLATVVSALRDDPRFVGGAVAVPYKRQVIPYLDELEEEAAAIGAVNAIYRRGSDLVGANTDGAAAFLSIETLGAKLVGSKVVLLGVGGVGRACATFLAREIGLSGEIWLVTRSTVDPALVEQLCGFCRIETRICWPADRDVLAGACLLVNCTPIGSEMIQPLTDGSVTLMPFAPLGAIDHLAPVTPGGNSFRTAFAEANHEAILRNLTQTWQALRGLGAAAVYDVVYQPAQTILVSLARNRGLAALGGEMMNLDQAAIAFARAAGAISGAPRDPLLIRKAMLES